MFRIVCDPSSGSTELCLTEITLSGSQIFFMCLVGVWQHNFEPAVCVHVLHYKMNRPITYFRLKILANCIITVTFIIRLMQSFI